MTAIVETRDLTRRYGSNLALDHLNLTIPEGAIFGFFGPNGAGKTTTMRILTTLLAPSAGEARVAGVSVVSDPRAVRRFRMPHLSLRRPPVPTPFCSAAL